MPYFHASLWHSVLYTAVVWLEGIKLSGEILWAVSDDTVYWCWCSRWMSVIRQATSLWHHQQLKPSNIISICRSFILYLADPLLNDVFYEWYCDTVNGCRLVLKVSNQCDFILIIVCCIRILCVEAMFYFLNFCVRADRELFFDVFVWTWANELCSITILHSSEWHC